MSATIMTLQDKDGNTVAPRTSANAVITASGKSVEAVLNGCWIEFTDENGNPTDVPYLHWIEEVSE